MNKVLNVFFVITIAIGLASCSSGDSSDNSLINGFNVSIDGQAYKADNITATQQFGKIIIETTNADERGITLFMPNYTIGTYTDAIIVYSVGQMSFDYINRDSSGELNGSVTIASLNNNIISGYFQCKAYRNAEAEPVILSNGTFQNIPVTLGIDPLGEGYYFALVNGVSNTFINAVADKINNRIHVAGVGHEHSIEIDLPENIGTGTYTIDNSDEGLKASLRNNIANSNWYSVSGTLTITQLENEWIDGTFTLSGIDDQGNEKAITGGQFHAPLVERN